MSRYGYDREIKGIYIWTLSIMRKELREINEMFTPIKEKQIVDDSDVIRYQKIRAAKQHFNLLIEQYLNEKHISIAEITKKDINYLGKKYNEKDREILIQQIMYFLETNFGKPLKRIKENNMSALFKEIDNDGWINTRSKKSSKGVSEQWSVSTSTENGWWDLWWDEEADHDSSWELFSC